MHAWEKRKALRKYQVSCNDLYKQKKWKDILKKLFYVLIIYFVK